MKARSRRTFKVDMSLFGKKVFVFVTLYGMVVAQTGRQYHGDPDGIVFPGPISTRNGKTNSYDEPTEKVPGGSDISKSLRLAQEINSVQSMDDFLQLVEGVPANRNTFLLSSRIGDTGQRSNAEHATPAKCIPELQPVSLKQDNDPSTIYYPSCTRVMRCGGCCSHSLLSCQPTATEVRNFEVLVATIGDSMGLSYKGKRIVPLEEHTKCKCDCRIKPEHCTEKQTYVPDECRCVCSNVDEEQKCGRNNDTKLWDPDLCTCLCRNHQECNTGYYFDQNTCRCRQVSLSRSWFAPTKGADYRFGQTQKPENVPPVIVSLDAADPRRKPKDDPEYK